MNGSAPRADRPEAVGFIGLGQIGAPMAKRLRDWPGGLTVFDVVAAATEAFARKGNRVASSPAEVAQLATVISVMVRDDDQVRDVLSGPNGVFASAAAGTVVAIHSTVEPDTVARLATDAAKFGVHVIDAPVSGGALGAHGGTLALLIGGDAEVVERIRGPFGCFASLIAHLGPVGAGTRAKLARNLITFASFVAVGEALRLAEAAGVDLAALGDVVRHSDAVTGGPGAVMLRPDAGPLAQDDSLRPIFEHTCALGEKDLDLALGLADSLGLNLPIAALAREGLASALGVPHS